MEERRCILSVWVPSDRKSGDSTGSNERDRCLQMLHVQLRVQSKKARATDLEWDFLMLAGVDVVEACLGSKSVGVDWQLP